MTDRIDKLRSSRPFSVLDAIIVAVVSVLFLIPLFIPARQGKSVSVTYQGKTTVYELSTDRIIDFDGKISVEIKGGKVRVGESDCPSKTCVARGEISSAGETIVCLPNDLVVRISGDEIDAVTGGCV
jgi:hypothetical protein